MLTFRSKGLATAVAVAGLALAGIASPALAIPIAGDRTTIDVTSIGALNAAGVTVSGLGSATILSAPGLLFAVLPVTGGDVDLPTSFTGTIEHAGSGLRLNVLGTDVDLTDFVLNTATGFVSGTVQVGAVSAPGALLFDVVPCDSGPPGTCQTLSNMAVIPTGFGLRVSNDLGLALSQLIPGLPNLGGLQFGVANTAIRAVPEPGSALLLGSALLGLGLRRRHRSA